MFGKSGIFDRGSASTHRRVDALTRPRVQASTRPRVDASTGRRVDASTRRGVEASTRRCVDTSMRRRVEGGYKYSDRIICHFPNKFWSVSCSGKACDFSRFSRANTVPHFLQKHTLKKIRCEYNPFGNPYIVNAWTCRRVDASIC